MRKLFPVIIIVLSAYIYFTWKPSTATVVDDMSFGDTPSYSGIKYHTSWGESEWISGHVRRIDRHYDRSIPVITYDLVLASGEFKDPEIVKVRNKGGGNYFWSSKKKPKGSILFYHTIPASRSSQKKLDKLEVGDDLELLAKISETSEIRGDNDAFVKLMHGNHKFILVQQVKTL